MPDRNISFSCRRIDIAGALKVSADWRIFSFPDFYGKGDADHDLDARTLAERSTHLCVASKASGYTPAAIGGALPHTPEYERSMK